MDRQTHRTTLTVTALALLPLAAACGTEKAGGTGRGSDSAGPRSPLTGVHWTVDSVTVDGTTHKAPAAARVHIDDSGRAQGNYGCNHFSARASIDGDRIRFSDAASTEMGCDDLGFEEHLARTLLDDTLRAKAADGRLTLTTGSGDTVRLTEEKDAPLYGTRWTVTGLGSGETSQSLPSGTEGRAHLTFDDRTGKVTGSAGCNRVTARATVGDGTITLGTPSTTRRMCDASLMDLEKRLLGLFDSKVDYRLDHRSLTLTSANGESVSTNADM
ncbi:META domain-containing protein [Streptomyces broussonetiae]|uniref:META domain-containing protein n=1 Tax=Streptomyces broussonetiae TaxID=2686304 RepID=A0ABV5E4Y5_9ACTN